MIPNSVLLPPLSTKDRAEFDRLCADFSAARERISRFSNEARRTRKDELRAKLQTAPSGQLLTIGAELETLSASFLQAKQGAKAQLKALRPRYVPLFNRLLDACQSHANTLIARSNKSWEQHFAECGAQPSGESPVVASLLLWKKQLADKRDYLRALDGVISTPIPPDAILSYTSTTKN